MTTPIHKRLGEFVGDNLLGCTFIGIGNDKEVFVSFDHDDKVRQTTAKDEIRNQFGDEIGEITTIVAVSMAELQTLVDGLNKTVEEMVKEEQKNDLLDIGDF